MISKQIYNLALRIEDQYNRDYIASIQMSNPTINTIGQRWVNIAQYCSSVTRYNVLIRQISITFDVLILKSANSWEGLYLVGDTGNIIKVRDMLLQIVTLVERTSYNAERKGKYQNVHMNTFRADYKSRAMDVFVRNFEYLQEHQKIKILGEKCPQLEVQRALCLEYIAQSTLKYKKLYHVTIPKKFIGKL